MSTRLAAQLVAIDPVERIRAIRAALPGRIVFTTSFGLEDQVLTHLIAQSGAEIEFATLDTGRLFPETYALWAQTEARYGVKIASFFPHFASVETCIAAQGIDGFYTSIEARKACCHIRKVEPLGRALKGASVWLTGLRADQSAARGAITFVEENAQYGVLKISPLLDWSRDDAARFAAEQDVPVNPLHEKGFLSIGCAPCTRAIQPGEPERAGRWWWEDEAKKECGLHVGPDGKFVRASNAEARG